MSSVPNTQLEGLLAGGQLIGQASQNQATTFQREAQQRAAGLEARGQDLQNTMQQRQLGAEAENYRKLNESRERMQQSEMAQQESQFSRAQEQDRELKLMDQEFSLAIAKAQAKAKQKAAEIVAGQKDDATLAQLRKERAAAADEARRLEQALNAARTARDLSRDVKGQRIEDMRGRVTSFYESAKLLGTQAQTAMGNAISDAILQNTRRSGGFSEETARYSLGENMQGVTEGVPDPFGMGGVATGLAAMERVLLQNIADATLGFNDTETVRQRMTSFERSPTEFASRVIDNAFERYDDAFGVAPEQKAAAKEIFLSMVVNGAVLGNVQDELLSLPPVRDPRLEESGRMKVAQGIAKLRQSGMQDVQILAVLESLEGMAERSSSIVSEQGLAATGIQGGKGEVLQQTLTGVGNIVDGIESVLKDQGFMRQHAGGELVDIVKFDLPKVFRMGESAFAMDRKAPQMQEFTGQIGKLGIRDPKQVEELVDVLIKNDPELQRMGFQLNPAEIAQMVLGLEQQASALGGRAQGMAEEEDLAVQQYTARGAGEGAQFEIDAFNEMLADLQRRRGG